ncbi:CdaR family transcriptional regulator [Lentzea sp. HUAS12]|uniref:PucR family transcriptional regulator n=1 Tax=Lentzea sp. HUAS12 TaxID=2951806 RepID=UPI00209D594B|nr:helix-turn-helix domain-containing protein [Lentzea sp. HUAS12]USX53437.1 helix-turn-helix domain-containing protein [Lentzea sp. HUAS12]
MSDADLQSIVDELAEHLQRSVAIDDPSIRLIAASRHFGDEDALRIRSVLDRAIEPAVVEHLFAQGIARWTGPGVVAVENALPRLCAPVRCNGMLLGYLWLIDAGGSFTEAEIAAADEAAATAGTVLYRRLLLHERSKARQEAILRELVSPDAAVRGLAIADLHAEQLFGDDFGHFTVLSVQRRTAEDAAAHQVAFEAALEEGVRAVTDDVALMVANRARGWILLIQRHPPARALVDTIADRVTTRLRRLTEPSARLAFGLGNTVTDLRSVALSYEHATLAARAALLLPGTGDLARWGELGPYELLLKLPADDLLTTALTPAVAALEQADNHADLIGTLTTFFDHAGNIQRTADSLTIHRATLYQRLKRIEQITGCSLDNGDDRLVLHLGLKLRTLAAAYRGQTYPN